MKFPESDEEMKAAIAALEAAKIASEKRHDAIMKTIAAMQSCCSQVGHHHNFLHKENANIIDYENGAVRYCTICNFKSS